MCIVEIASIALPGALGCEICREGVTRAHICKGQEQGPVTATIHRSYPMSSLAEGPTEAKSMDDMQNRSRAPMQLSARNRHIRHPRHAKFAEKRLEAKNRRPKISPSRIEFHPGTENKLLRTCHPSFRAPRQRRYLMHTDSCTTLTLTCAADMIHDGGSAKKSRIDTCTHVKTGSIVKGPPRSAQTPRISEVSCRVMPSAARAMKADADLTPHQCPPRATPASRLGGSSRLFIVISCHLQGKRSIAAPRFFLSIRTIPTLQSSGKRWLAEKQCHINRTLATRIFFFPHYNHTLHFLLVEL